MTGTSGAADPCASFNIVLHGLFVIDVQNFRLQISTPDCTGLKHKHQYKAGYWKNSYKHFVEIKKGIYSPPWTTNFSLPNYTDLPVLINSKMGKPKYKNAYISLVLPFPRAITGLRFFQAAEIDYSQDWIKATKFPLVTALTYDSAPRFAPFPGTPWDPPTNYHIFAEPDHQMNCDAALDHGKQALQKLWALFDTPPSKDPLPKSKTNCSKDPDQPPDGLCVDSEEETSLSELNWPIKQAPEAQSNVAPAGVHMPTCAVFVVPQAS